MTMIAMAVAGTLAIALALSPLGAVKRIDVTGAQHTGAEMVRARSGLRTGQPFLLVRSGPVRARLERLPWIARISIHRRLVHGLPVVAMRVVERVAAATVRTSGGQWMTVDGTGRVLEQTPVAPPGLLPVIVGRIGPTPVGARILAARLAPVLALASPLTACAAADASLGVLASAIADSRPLARYTALRGGIAKVAPGLLVPDTARRGLLVASHLPRGTESSVVAVQVDGDRVRVLVRLPESDGRAAGGGHDPRTPALETDPAAALAMALETAVAFDFGAVDSSDPITERGRTTDSMASPGEALAARDVSRRQEALAILLERLDLSSVSVVDLSVPDAPVVTRR